MTFYERAQAVDRKQRSLIHKPRTVYPSAINTHGLFGLTYLRQHMMIDSRWTVDHLTDQYKGMGALLGRRLAFKKLETTFNHKLAVHEYRSLKNQCRMGRQKLQNAIEMDTQRKISRELINHKDLQRLYKKLPIELVVENINQRTFGLRKERDRLRHNLDTLKKVYEEKMMQCSALQNRIHYDNVFRLAEEDKCDEFLKLIENSRIRLGAIKTINGTYTKMLGILKQAEIFYEPILRSLDHDYKNQSDFINTVLYLGTPLIFNFKILSEEHRLMEDKIRKSIQAKMHVVATYNRDSLQSRTHTSAKGSILPIMDHTEIIKRYQRETESMKFLKLELESIGNVIKQVQFATLCSQVREIYPRMKQQDENNRTLQKVIFNNILGHDNLKERTKRAGVLEGVLMNNLSEEEIVRLETIKHLQKLIEKEDAIEAEQIRYMKSRKNAMVVLRLTLWKLNDVLRYVGKNARPTYTTYRTSYLKLPLLKFEMLDMRSYPPETFEQNMDKISEVIKKKLATLMKAYRIYASSDNATDCLAEYQQNFVESYENEDVGDGDAVVEEEEIEFKPSTIIPDRIQMKMRSYKLVEEHMKKDD